MNKQIGKNKVENKIALLLAVAGIVVFAGCSTAPAEEILPGQEYVPEVIETEIENTDEIETEPSIESTIELEGITYTNKEDKFSFKHSSSMVIDEISHGGCTAVFTSQSYADRKDFNEKFAGTGGATDAGPTPEIIICLKEKNVSDSIAEWADENVSKAAFPISAGLTNFNAYEAFYKEDDDLGHSKIYYVLVDESVYSIYHLISDIENEDIKSIINSIEFIEEEQSVTNDERWITYTNNEYGFSFDYPNEWSLVLEQSPFESKVLPGSNLIQYQLYKEDRLIMTISPEGEFDTDRFSTESEVPIEINGLSTLLRTSGLSQQHVFVDYPVENEGNFRVEAFPESTSELEEVNVVLESIVFEL